MKKSLLQAMMSMSLLFLAPAAWAQAVINGTVMDGTDDPVIGAIVSVKGHTGGVNTDIDGNFRIQAEPGTILVFSSVGFQTLEMPAADNMRVVLHDDNALLDEVVVIGYGTVKRGDVTTAVSSVSEKELANRPIVSAAQGIQGKAAGVNVMSPNGSPGSAPQIRVRGTTSMNGSNSPLYVVDGVPVDNIDFLAASDIESMQILKDASSAAIYGSRGANGVVLITTKGGQSKDAKISLNAYYGITNVENKIKPLNTAQYRELMEEIGIVSLPDDLTDQTNWFDEVFRTGRTQNYQLAISQSADKMRYYLSGGYTREDGTIRYSNFERFNFRANIEGTLRSWLEVRANISYSDYTSNGGIISGNGGSRGGVIISCIQTPTYAPIWDTTNPDYYYNNFYGVSGLTHPLDNLARTKYDKAKENRILATGEMILHLAKGLQFQTKFTLDRRNYLKTTFLDPVHTTYGREQGGTGSDERNVNTVLTWDNVLNYKLQAGNNSFDFMAGTSWTDSDYRNSWINGSKYRDDQVQTLNGANKIALGAAGSSASEWAIQSFFGRVSYNYDSRYLLTANIRVDGSSKLHPDHRWSTFPSVSAAWRLSQESFLRDKRWLTDLKLRAGWGQTGNQGGIGDYAYLQRYNFSYVEWYKTPAEGDTFDYANAVPGLVQANLRTEDLKWERTTQTNVGVDLSLLNGRLSFTGDVYYKKTTDMLMWVSLPSGSAAASSIQRNEGEMSNKGIEFSITSHQFEGDFSWSTSYNMSFNKNRLDKLALQQVYYGGSTNDYVNEKPVRNEPGRPLGGFYGYISDGVDPETGELMYRDLNGDGRISSSDRTYIGDPNPDFTFGMTNNFSWKGFNLSIFLQGSYGNDILNVGRMDTEGMYNGMNQSTRVLDRWRIPGQITDVPKAGFDMKTSTYFIEDGSYLRVKDISLSYDVKGNWMKRAGISKIQPYVTATNLLTWTKYSGYDPEVNQYGDSGAVQGIDYGTYPQSRSFIFGLNIEF
ncbi:MAG: TonB-dependent receptor [Bacteroidales bacterium]|nr:TonB-dependent receptor [Bacteroidales bacterium]